MARRAEVAASALALAVIAFLLVENFIAAGFAAQREDGVLEIHIKDHRDAIGDFARLNIVIDKISLSPKAGLKFWKTGWKDFAANPDTIDLTKYVGKNRVRVYRGTLDAGSFEAFHLKIKHMDGILKKDQHRTSIKNLISAVKLPFEVRPGGETLLIIDLTVGDFSDHPPRGYELGLQGYELYIDRKLIEKVPPG
jgi:hypothetical protein